MAFEILAEAILKLTGTQLEVNAVLGDCSNSISAAVRECFPDSIVLDSAFQVRRLRLPIDLVISGFF